MKTSTRTVLRPTRNVVAFLEGDDPKLKDEVVIVCAHYDHVGVLRTHEAGADSVFNGADDNTSGTCGLLEENRKIGMTLAYNGERWFYQSDHASLARKGIPVLFFNTGDHLPTLRQSKARKGGHRRSGDNDGLDGPNQHDHSPVPVH